MTLNSYVYRVTIVVDRSYGAAIRDLPPDEPAWIVETPENISVIKELWKSTRQQTHLTGITSFDDTDELPEQVAISVLDNVDLHHGYYSHSPPYDALRVIGITSTDELDLAIKEYGFVQSSFDGAVVEYLRTSITEP